MERPSLIAIENPAYRRAIIQHHGAGRIGFGGRRVRRAHEHAHGGFGIVCRVVFRRLDILPLEEARARQSKRFGARGPQVNGRMTPRQVRKFCTLKPESMALLKAAMEDLGLSARAHDKVLRVARTIADLEAHEDIKPQHIAEAVGYRSLDRSVWA
jgi:hypothetical protein